MCYFTHQLHTYTYWCGYINLLLLLKLQEHQNELNLFHIDEQLALVLVEVYYKNTEIILNTINKLISSYLVYKTYLLILVFIKNTNKSKIDSLMIILSPI